MPPAPGVSLALRPPCFPGSSLSLSRSVRCVAHGKEISKIRPPKSTPIFTFFKKCFGRHIFCDFEPQFHPVKSRVLFISRLKRFSPIPLPLTPCFLLATTLTSDKSRFRPSFRVLLRLHFSRFSCANSFSISGAHPSDKDHANPQQFNRLSSSSRRGVLAAFLSVMNAARTPRLPAFLSSEFKSPSRNARCARRARPLSGSATEKFATRIGRSTGRNQGLSMM